MCKTTEQETRGNKMAKTVCTHTPKTNKQTKKVIIEALCFNSFRFDNKFLRAGFPASPCCSPHNVHAAGAWEEDLAE